MGMYTEFYFRANIADGPVADWLDRQINDTAGEDSAEWFETGFDDHPFFTCPRWDAVFRGGGAVYQESRLPIFRRPAHCGPYSNQLVIASSLKDYGGETDAFIGWIRPHLKRHHDAFLGYSLYEDADQPRLHFVGADPDVVDGEVVPTRREIGPSQ